MIRRTYKITGETDAHIARLAKEMALDKEHVVQMALDAGLPEIEKFWERIGKPLGFDMVRKQLLAKTYNVSKASIRQTKNRAKEKVKDYLEARFQQKGGDI